MFGTRAVSDGVFNITALLVMATEWTRAYSQPKTQAFDRSAMERKNVIAQETINTRLCCQEMQGLVLVAQKSPAKGRHNSGNQGLPFGASLRMHKSWRPTKMMSYNKSPFLSHHFTKLQQAAIHPPPSPPAPARFGSSPSVPKIELAAASNPISPASTLIAFPPFIRFFLDYFGRFDGGAIDVWTAELGTPIDGLRRACLRVAEPQKVCVA